MSELKQNKSFQFICGCLTITFIWYLYKNQVFEIFFSNNEGEGLESVPLATLILTSLVSAIQLVGIISIGIVSGILKPAAEWVVDAIRNRFPKVDQAASKIEDAVDLDKLVAILNKLDERLSNLEGKSD